MYLFDKVSKNIARKMAIELKLDEDKEEVIAYGAYGVLQTTWSIFLIAVFGFICGLFIESMLISFAAAFLRKYSGGAHASSPNTCAVIGVIIFILLSFIANNLMSIGYIFIYVIIGINYIFTYLMLYKFCPNDSPAKPIKKQETIKRLRKKSFLFVSILALFSLIFLILWNHNLFFLKIVLCISLGFAWQSITLTLTGHLITNKLDDILKSISKKIGGGENNEQIN